jgi:hypothetical protein
MTLMDGAFAGWAVGIGSIAARIGISIPIAEPVRNRAHFHGGRQPQPAGWQPSSGQNAEYWRVQARCAPLRES